MKKTVTLTVPPGLQLASTRANLLARLLSKANCERSEGLFYAKQGVSEAALVATLKGYPKGQTYCLASPIECYADHKTVYVLNQATLTNTDALSMVEKLNHFLQQDGICLEIVGDGLWLFTVGHHRDVTFAAPHTLVGKSMAHHLPTGNDAVYWRRLLTECQMLLSQTLSVWFWGIGVDNVKLACDFDAIFTEDLILSAKAHNTNATIHQQVNGWSNTLLKMGDNLCITPHCTETDAFEQLWLVPLFASLKSGAISFIRLVTQNQMQYTFLRRHLYYFWRKTRPLTAFLDNGLMSLNEH